MSDAKITVIDTDFACSGKYSESTVMGYKDASTMFNAALFRIEQSSTKVILDMINNELNRGDTIFPGMLDANQFTG